MGKITGFREYKRETPPRRPVEERIKDFNEIMLPWSEDRVVIQAARCMDCGTPFCHNACPNHNLVPEWNELVYRGLWYEAWLRLMATHIFPEFTGRVCPALCEGSCVNGLIGEAVCVRGIELAIIEKAYREGWMKPRPPLERSGKKVAVVGSGPAGLACAERLNRCGHSVTVFERADRPGGLLMYGIPNMKLDKNIVFRRLRLMEAEGIEFATGVEVGRNYSIERLLTDYDAIVLACGARKPRDLQVDGRNLKGIHFAVDYLTAATRRLLDHGFQLPPEMDAAGKDVVVIGGGDTGTDCVATAIRQGCRSVVQLEIMPAPPLRRLPSNPWPQYPRVLKVDYGQEEAAALYGSDPRHYCWQTRRFIGDGEGRVRAVEAEQVEWVYEGGRLQPRSLPGTVREWPAQLVLLAMGFVGPESDLPEQLDLEQDERGNIRASFVSFATSRPGIFAAGDARRGQSLVIWAIQEGRQAAAAVDRYLRGWQ